MVNRNNFLSFFFFLSFFLSFFVGSSKGMISSHTTEQHMQLLNIAMQIKSSLAVWPRGYTIFSCSTQLSMKFHGHKNTNTKNLKLYSCSTQLSLLS